MMMLDDQDNVFDIIYSLPAISHSNAIATRTPAAGYGQESKYMPDYGGILETPFSKLKNNALTSGLPFKPTSIYRGISKLETPHGAPLSKQFSNDCLIVAPYLNSNSADEYSIIRAIGQHLYLDLIRDSTDGLGTQKSSVTNYVQVPYSNDITGIKFSGHQSDFLTVKFVQGVKTIKLNASYEVPTDDSCCDVGLAGPAIHVSASVAEKSHLRVRDVCLNPFNKSIQATASDNVNTSQVKIYDISTNSRRPIQTIDTGGGSASSSATTSYGDERVLRGRTIRWFESSKPSLRGIQEIDHIPYHLVNMILTTDQEVELIDPRSNMIAQTYVDRSKIPSFYPIEYMRRTRYSCRNSHQFYSLSNVHMRVFDTRFPGVPVNQMNHMLDSDSYDSMNMKVIRGGQSDLDILCVSSRGRLCFFTFNQNQENKLINPRANHMPYHEPSLDEMIQEGNSELFGLDFRDQMQNKNSMKEMFSVYQLTDDGDISVRRFLPNDEENCPNLTYESQVSKILRRDKYVSNEIVVSSKTHSRYECEDRDILDSNSNPEDADYINLLNTDAFADAENRFQSKRASERYLRTLKKLDKN